MVTIAWTDVYLPGDYTSTTHKLFSWKLAELKGCLRLKAAGARKVDGSKHKADADTIRRAKCLRSDLLPSPFVLQ